MPTENTKLVSGKVFVQTNEDEKPKKLKAIDINFVRNNEDGAADSARYFLEGLSNTGISVPMTIPKEKFRQILKLHGLERITRKRFKKLLMSCRMQRNDAEIVARAFHKNKIQYTPLGVQKIIETINAEAEKRQKE